MGNHLLIFTAYKYLTKLRLKCNHLKFSLIIIDVST